MGSRAPHPFREFPLCGVLILLDKALPFQRGLIWVPLLFFYPPLRELPQAPQKTVEKEEEEEGEPDPSPAAA